MFSEKRGQKFSIQMRFVMKYTRLKIISRLFYNCYWFFFFHSSSSETSGAGITSEIIDAQITKKVWKFIHQSFYPNLKFKALYYGHFINFKEKWWKKLYKLCVPFFLRRWRMHIHMGGAHAQTNILRKYKCIIIHSFPLLSFLRDYTYSSWNSAKLTRLEAPIDIVW